MNKKIGLLLLLLAVCTALSAQTALNRGMTITKSVKIKRGIYTLNGFDNLNKAAILVCGDNITIDFNKAVLKGSGGKKYPNEFYGVAILLTGGKNITLKNLKATGYKVALLAYNVDGLKIENCDFSYNYRQHLNSTQEKEDISDWMSYHQNEKNEWLRYGAAIYLRGCNSAVISGNKVTGGQNALLMTECNLATIYSNDFSFNSGIGIGFYRSSNNKVLHNRLNFNVRGYSHGIYNRGQDSAGILVYEQSNSNLFYKNSVTHSGDGFFLWAGQTTMNTGQGGCNDNQLLYNDFSYAPTNGVEVTFSRNVIAQNRIFECDHGIWGGYSFNSAFTDNQFRQNRIGIAIEHGQHNEITGNTFIGNKEAIKLWSRAQQPSDWGYAKYRDTRSVDYTIGTNNFNRNGIVFNLQRTDSLRIFDNIYSGNETVYAKDSAVTNIDSTPLRIYDTAAMDYSLPNAMDPFEGNGKFAGRKNIYITEWGPYDFRYPLIWNTNPTDSSGEMEFEVLGPKGKWKIISAKGLEAFVPIANEGVTENYLANSFTGRKKKGARTDIEIIAEYNGPAFTDAFGNKIPANKPYRFYFRKFFQPISFLVKWFPFDGANNPTKMTTVEEIEKSQPIKTDTVNKLDYAWWDGIKTTDSVYKQFLTLAEGSAVFDKGTYESSVTWDDAVRVYVDGKLVLNEWIPSKYTFDEAPNKKVKLQLNGKHQFRVEHVALGGFATLSMRLSKVN